MTTTEQRMKALVLVRKTTACASRWMCWANRV